MQGLDDEDRLRCPARVRAHWNGIGVTLFVNWAIKPFSMALLAWLLIRGLFAPWLPSEQLDSYVAGLILLAAAPCTAMVFVWSRTTTHFSRVVGRISRVFRPQRYRPCRWRRHTNPGTVHQESVLTLPVPIFRERKPANARLPLGKPR
jgi:hypothetical protein